MLRSTRGSTLTRDGLAYMLGKYVRRAAEVRRELRGAREGLDIDTIKLAFSRAA